MNHSDRKSAIRVATLENSRVESYLKFAEKEFGRHAYQADSRYLDWLYEANPHAVDGKRSCFIAVSEDDRIVGCIHKMHLMQGPECSPLAVLHNLMVDERHRGGIGFLLAKNAAARESQVYIPGVVPPLANLYPKMGYRRLPSAWYRKVINPVRGAVALVAKKVLKRPMSARYFESSVSTSLEPFDVTCGPDEGLLEGVAEAINRGAESGWAPWWDAPSIRWRFFHPAGPRHALIYQESGGEVADLAVVSLGPRHGVNVGRVLALVASSSIALKALMDRVEVIVNDRGGHVLLTYATDRRLNRMLSDIGMPGIKDPPHSYALHRKGPAPAAYALMGGAGDFGFEAIPSTDVHAPL